MGQGVWSATLWEGRDSVIDSWSHIFIYFCEALALVNFHEDRPLSFTSHQKSEHWLQSSTPMRPKTAKQMARTFSHAANTTTETATGNRLLIIFIHFWSLQLQKCAHHNVSTGRQPCAFIKVLCNILGWFLWNILNWHFEIVWIFFVFLVGVYKFWFWNLGANKLLIWSLKQRYPPIWHCQISSPPFAEMFLFSDEAGKGSNSQHGTSAHSI